MYARKEQTLTTHTAPYQLKQRIQQLDMGHPREVVLELLNALLRIKFEKIDRQKEKAMTTTRVEMTFGDRDRLTTFLERKSKVNGWHEETPEQFHLLRQKLISAICKNATDISPDVVTLGSIVHLFELDTGEHWKFTLSFPTDANIDEGRISVLAPLGTAILGQRVGDLVDWPVPSGTIQTQITQIDYQPEAAGVIDEQELSTT